MADIKLDVSFRNLESSPALHDYAKSRVERVLKYVDRPMDAHVTLSHRRHEMHADIQINVHQANLVLRGKAVRDDMYAALDLAMDKIERQVRRYKDKLKNHKPTPDGTPLKVKYGVLDTGTDATGENDAPSPPKIIRSTEFLARPMALEDAVMQMDLMNNDFLVYRDASKGGVNVIYRRKDGNIGLIEASRG